LRRRDRETADDRAVGELERLLELALAANAAAELHAQAADRADPLDRREIHRPTLLGAVEIDDVQPPRAPVAVTRRELGRVDVVARDAVELAAQQPHAAAVADVDCRDQLHRSYSFRKFSSSRAPKRDERSGWNCAP